MMVSIERDTAGTCIPTVLESELLPMTTAVAILGRIGRIDQRDDSSSVRSFGEQSLPEEAPTCVQNALGEVALHHALDRQVFEGDETERGDQPADQLAQVVLALVGFSQFGDLPTLKRQGPISKLIV
jgi:hypothetical protein